MSEFTHNNKCVSFHVRKVDDTNLQLKITIYQKYQWEDPRIRVNKTHPYWKGKNNEMRHSIRLCGHFVEECLWTPTLQFLGTVEMSSWNPQSTSTSNPRLQSYLNSDSTLVVSSMHMKLTIACNMNFDKYPFDQQVSIFL